MFKTNFPNRKCKNYLEYLVLQNLSIFLKMAPEKKSMMVHLKLKQKIKY